MKYTVFGMFLFLISFFSTLNCFSQETVKDKQIDELFKVWDNDNTPGVAIGVVRKGELIYAKGYGMANLEHDIPISTNSVFDIASVSKQFTGMAIGMMIDQGKLSEEDDIRKYLPDFPEYGHVITVGNLLHHTSGIRDWPTLMYAAGYQFDDVYSFDYLISMIYKQKELNFIPGDETVYSNSNYNLLVQILEVITGDSFSAWMRENVFKPLDMSDTHFHINHTRVVKNRVDSYAPIGGTMYSNIGNNLCAVGSSSLYTTIEDLGNWVINFGKKEIGGEKVIEMMTKETKLNDGSKNSYGFGIGVGNISGREKWSHSGGWAGFRTILDYYPEEEFGVIVLSNMATVAPGSLSQQLFDLYFPEKAMEKETESSDEGNDEFDPFTETKFKARLFDNYIGDFELLNSQGFTVSFTREGDNLFAQATGQQKFPIFPSSDTTFFLKAVRAWVAFHENEKGKFNRITLHQNGELPGVRKEQKGEKYAPGKDDLLEFEGKYFSEELSTDYMVFIRDDKLIIKQERLGEIALKPIESDRFQTLGLSGEIVFERDEGGVVNSFRLSMMPRTRNILFQKMAGKD